jgi:hypothetical protein
MYLRSLPSLLAACALGLAACGGEENAPARSPDAEMKQAELKFAQCMREQGVDMPDPKGGHPDFGSVDRTSPEFQKALPKCQPLLTGEGNS